MEKLYTYYNQRGKKEKPLYRVFIQDKTTRKIVQFLTTSSTRRKELRMWKQYKDRVGKPFITGFENARLIRIRYAYKTDQAKLLTDYKKSHTIA